MTGVPREKLLRVLRLYQDEAVDFLIEGDLSALFVDMGLGKTAIALHAFLEFEKPILLVGPIQVIQSVWEKEASEWIATRGLTFSLVRGDKKERDEARAKKADVYLVNPELLEETLNSKIKFKVLVIDESSMFKDPSAKRFKVLRKHLKRFDRRIIMTGTPSPNSLMDLWSQIFLLDRGESLDTSFNRFKHYHFYPVDWQGFKLRPHDWAEEAILSEISHLVFRMARKEAITEVLHIPVLLTLPDRVAKIYKQMEKKAFAEIREEVKRKKVITAPMAATKMMKLRQIAGGFIYDEEGESTWLHNEKLEAARRIVEGNEGSPVIISYQFVEELEALKEAFPEGVVFGKSKVEGQPRRKWSQIHESRWNAGEIPVLFLHPQSGAHGLNLQFGGSTLIIYSSSFSAEQMQQLVKRIDRPGQQEGVMIFSLLVQDSVDYLIREVLKSREEGQSRTLEIIESYIKERTP